MTTEPFRHRLAQRLRQLPVRLRPWFRFALKLAAGVALLLFLVVLGTAFVARSQPDLEAWHRLAPAEPEAAELRRMDWAGYLRAEQAVFDELQAALATQARPGRYRYDLGTGLRVPPGATDWNRSYESLPAGKPRGGVLLLHGMSDSPYSLHHVAAWYEAQGFAVLMPRLPGHGTVPAGLLHATWPDWLAVVELSMRELRARAGPGVPLHVVGYSNGGALALKYAMDRVDIGGDNGLPAPDRVVLVSPMIGVARGAAFTKLLPLLGGIRYFEKSRWLDVQPEYNPFKYNSFPVAAAHQSWLLTGVLKAQVLELRASGRASRLPPMLAFQSVIDSTVSTPDVVRAFYDHLPANGSELVLFDINRQSVLAPLFDEDANAMLGTLRPDKAHTYRLTVLGNRDPGTLAVAEHRLEPGSPRVQVREAGLSWPANMYSLSHVALPFPMDDPLYGLEPRATPDYGIRLGTMVLHGERGALSVGAEQLMRLGCNPFFDYLIARIHEGVLADTGARPGQKERAAQDAALP